MYVTKETEYQNNPVIKSQIEVLSGGAIVAAADFKTASTECKAGAIVGEDSNGLFHLVKTAKIVAGGSASAPRIGLVHEFKVGDIISDGHVALEIDTITVGETYDTLAFTTGQLTIYATDTVLYQAETADTAGSGTDAEATVQDTVGDFLKCTIPVTSYPVNFNGVTLQIGQAADDVLAVAYTNGVLLISLANTTAANNNVAAIQAAVRALGTVEGLDWSEATFAGTDWDAKQTGATLTTATDNFQGGVNKANMGVKYAPAGLSINPVDLSKSNQSIGVLLRGSVSEANMPQYVDATIKALLPLIRFE